MLVIAEFPKIESIDKIHLPWFLAGNIQTFGKFNTVYQHTPCNERHIELLDVVTTQELLPASIQHRCKIIQ